MVMLKAVAHDKRCEAPLFGDSTEAVASYQADTDRPIAMLKDACEAKFSREKRTQFHSAGISDVEIEERYPAEIATLYFNALRSKLRASAAPSSIVDFSLDGKQFAENSTFLTLAGMYIKQGNLEDLYASTQAVLQSSYSATSPPKVSLLTDEASREFRKHLLSCQAHPTYGQIGCPVTIWGYATICTQTTLFGVTKDLPCIHVVDGE